MYDDYLDRTAGLRTFNGVQPLPHFDVQTPLQRFASLFTDSQSPGHIDQTNLLAAAPNPTPQAAPQPPAPPEPPPYLARVAAKIIPGLHGMMEQDQVKAQRDYQGKLVQYLQSIPHDQQTAYMASQNPAYIPALIAQREADEKKAQIQHMAAMIGGSPQDAAPSAPTGSGPIGAQGNNLVNIRDNAANHWQGQTGSVKGFAAFDKPEDGFRAGAKILSKYAADGVNTLDGVIQRWAPAADGNNVAKYAEFVSRETGIPRDANINPADPYVEQKLLGAMQKQEVGPQYSAPQDVVDRGVSMANGGALAQYAALSPAAGNPQPSAPAAAPSTPLAKYAQTYFDLAKQTGDPAYLEKGMALMTQQDTYKPETAQGKALSDRQHGYINDQQLGAMIGASTVDDSPLSGQELMDLLKEKEPNTASSVDQALRGVAMPSARSKDTQRVYALAGRVEPGFNPQVAAARNKNYQYFQPSGVGGQLLSSIKAIAGHAETAKKAFSGIGNTGSDYWNAAGNFVKSGYSNDTHTALNSYDEAINNLAPEIAKVVSGKTAVPEEEVSAQRKPFGHNLDPEAFNGAMNTAAEMVAKRAQIMLDNWQAAMNDGSKPPAAGLDKKTIDSFKSMGVDLSDYFDVTPATKTKSGGGGSPAPQGVDPDIWAHMTPEEQKLWQ